MWEVHALRWFGPRPWNAMAQSAPERRVPIPVGMSCAHCDEPVEAGGSGAFQFFPEGDGGSFRPYHEECFLRQFIGGVRHLLRKCSCYGNGGPDVDPGMTRREDARLAVKIHNEVHGYHYKPPRE
jgi:hypothetical protein